MKTKAIYLTILLANCTLLLMAQGTWKQVTDFGGSSRFEAVGFSIGDKGYFGTGTANWCGPYYKDFWEYNPATDVWTQKADFGGIARAFAVGFSIGNFGYIGTGQEACGSAVKDFWQYDPSSNTWMQKADVGGIGGRNSAIGFSIGNKGYIGTGDIINYSHQKDFWEYDPVTDSWIQKADFGGAARQYAAAFVINGKGYVGTGYNGSRLNDFWEYNPSTNSWSKKANFAGASRLGAVGFSLGNTGYIGTGEGNTSDLNDLYAYDPDKNSWEQMASFNGPVRDRAVGFSIGNKGYVGTGESWAGSGKFKDFWEYTPECSTILTVYADADADSFGDIAISLSVMDCVVPDGYVLDSTDCNDNNAAINPGAFEIFGDGIDNNCNGLIDESLPNPHPLPLISQPLVPDAIAPGETGFTLTLKGTGFFSESTVNWNGSARLTTFINSSQVEASILDSDIDTAGTAAITVFSPGPGGGYSNTVYFSVTKVADSVQMVRSEYSVGGSPQDPIIADFNLDGKLDIAIANHVYYSSVSILLGNGDGTFQSYVQYATGNWPLSPVSGDFNNDGKPDLAVANYLDNNLSVLLGNGDGTFNKQVQYTVGSSPGDLVTADFNGDGKLDLITANCSCFNPGESTVSVLLGNGDGTFQSQLQFDAGHTPVAIVTGDFDKDTKLDVAVANFYVDLVSVLRGNGDGTFQSPVAYPANQTPCGLELADYNADSKLDLVANNDWDHMLSILLGNGDGTFQAPYSYAVGEKPKSGDSGDLDADGKTDLIVGSQSTNSVTVLFGSGDGTFTRKTEFDAGGESRSLVIGDFNADGRLDVAVGNNNDAKITILLQKGEGLCSAPVNLNAPFVTSHSARLDWNDVASAEGYTLRYRVLGEKHWTLKTATTSARKIDGLQPGTEYVWSIRSFCKITPPVIISAWSSNQTFTTGVLKMETPAVNALDVYPNPFGQSATIIYSIANDALVQIALYDLSGKLLKMPVNENISAGLHSLSLNRDGLGQGIYFLKLLAGDELIVKKIVIE